MTVKKLGFIITGILLMLQVGLIAASILVEDRTIITVGLGFSILVILVGGGIFGRIFINTIRSLTTASAKRKFCFSDLYGTLHAAKDVVTGVTIQGGLPGVGTNGSTVASIAELGKLNNDFAVYKDSVMQFINPLNKVFFKKENGLTVLGRMSSILGQLNSSISNTVNDMQQQSETLTLTFEAFDITTLTMEKVDEIIQNAKRLASDLLQRTDDGRNAIVQTKGSMDQILDFSEKMVTITTTIVDISEKTNILAINAAIESARAGKHGQGFSIIAQEIRKLASNTKDASIEIKRIIEGIIEKIQKQAEMNELVYNTFSNIITYINKTTSLNEEIYKISRKSIIQGKEIQTAVNTLKFIAQKIISSSNKELFEVNEIMAIMKSIERLFTHNEELAKTLIVSAEFLEKHSRQ